MSQQPVNPQEPQYDSVTFARQHPVLVTLRYTVFRAMLLMVFGGVFYLIGFRDILLLMAAFLSSGAVSLFLLNRQRSNMSVGVSSAFSRLNQKIETSKSAEDID